MIQNIPKHVGNCASVKTLAEYRKGVLSETQRTALSNHLPTCELCKYTLNAIPSINQNELEEDMSILKRNITERLFEQKRKQRQSYLAKIAASLLFLIAFGYGTYFFTRSNDTAGLYNQYYQAYEIPESLLRSATNNIPPMSDNLAKAIATYKNLPYQKHTSDIPTSFEQNSYEDAFAQFINALTSLEKGEVNSAILQLEKVQQSKTKFSEDATWYLALAHLKASSVAKAESYIDQVLMTKDSFYYEKARDLKVKLNKGR